MSKKLNRNDSCSCGSGKKYKQCCMNLEQRTAKHDAQGNIRFSAEIVSSDSSGYLDLFKKFSPPGGSSLESSGEKVFTVTKEKSISKKDIKKFQRQENTRLSENLKKHDFEVFTPNQEDGFIPTSSNFQIEKNDGDNGEEVNFEEP